MEIEQSVKAVGNLTYSAEMLLPSAPWEPIEEAVYFSPSWNEEVDFRQERLHRGHLLLHDNSKRHLRL